MLHLVKAQKQTLRRRLAKSASPLKADLHEVTPDPVVGGFVGCVSAGYILDWMGRRRGLALFALGSALMPRSRTVNAFARPR